MATKTTRRKVSKVEKRLGSAVDFMLDRPPRCSEARDLIACVCYPSDICQEIQVFRSAGYSDPEIEQVYADLREHGRVTLDRPVFVKLTVGA